jgi:PadR family transcriptional regulator, regulatory protein AphA
MSRELPLTTTSFAVLGLLAIQPWSTYELTRQMDRSLGRVWPRAQSKLYEEPKKLVEHGLAGARVQAQGKRERTVYTITAKGRRELAAWLHTPGSGPVLEFEGLLKLFLADHGGKDDALATLAAARAWAVERNTDNLAAARAYLDGTARFQDRAAVNSLVGSFLTDFYAMVADWSARAAELVSAWPDDPAEATLDRTALYAVARRASWSEAEAT